VELVREFIPRKRIKVSAKRSAKSPPSQLKTSRQRIQIDVPGQHSRPSVRGGCGAAFSFVMAREAITNAITPPNTVAKRAADVLNLYLKTNPAIFIVCWDPAKKVWFAELLDPIRLGPRFRQK